MTATVNGVAWTANVKATAYKDPQQHLNVLGTSTNDNINVVLTNITTAGTYTLKGSYNSDTATGEYTRGASAYFSPYAGSVTLTVFNDTNVQGAFYFSATGNNRTTGKVDTVIITNAQFNVKR